ncbi:MAG: methionine--tRNA ligase [Chloroflexi bacterium]|nr:methionine--tRNA ligase [Chloroflexota bacterium]
MSERIFIGVAWPYVNGPLHLGHVAGCYLPADIFARYHRMKGNEVLMVSGSDQHGTPITVRADKEKTTPQAVVDRFHPEFLENWERLGISWDIYTSTGTANHRETAQDMFLKLREKGYIYEGTMLLPYCEKDQRYLPDRYVNGTCPHCGFENARGDQCDNCGKPLDPADLVSPRCSLCGTTPQFRERRHFMLKLSAFGGPLLEWLSDKGSRWRPNVVNFTTKFVSQGLQDRAITRDIAWGVPVPVAGWEDRRIYVWFEAVIGYLSASKEWAARRGEPEAWRRFWQEECKAYYFIGKDNIPFHTIIWPAMLMGYEGLSLPYDVPANEFLNLEGRQFSTSRNWAVWLPDYLARYDPDPLRYALAATMPETSDSDFSWQEFVRRNNNELVGTYGNLAHRVLTFTQRTFQGQVPRPGELDARSNELLGKAEEALGEADRSLALCHFRAALGAAMGLAHEANRYLDEMAPWRTAKTDLPATARTVYTSIAVIATLKTLMYPFLPFSSQRLHGMLGFTGEVQAMGWRTRAPEPGTLLPPPEALFVKLDEEEVVKQETARLGVGAG